jgi:hypothetical protein
MKTEPKLIKEGFTVITPTIFQGDTLCWATEDDNGDDIPSVFDTEEEALKEIADIKMDELRQFINGEREFPGWTPEEYIARYEEYEDGTIYVSTLASENGEDYGGDEILETTLEQWRKNR